MSRVIAAFALTVFVAFGAADAFAQISGPDERDSPLGPDVSGFLTIALGMIYLPKFDAEAEASRSGFFYETRQEVAGVPNFAAHISLIPAWGNNGIMVETGYELLSMRWRQDVRDEAGVYQGKSTLALSVLSLSTNYVRYFLSGADRIYLLAGAGYVWETARLTTETGGEGATDDAGFPNWRLNSGFGYLHQLHTGAIGAELRVDKPLSDTKLDLEDPYGPYEITLEHPVFIRLCFTFSIGRLIGP